VDYSTCDWIYYNNFNNIAAPTVTQTAESGRPALRVSWTKPLSPLPIIRYDVQYRVSNTDRWTTEPVTGSTTTLTSVVPGRGYDVRVRAVSQVLFQVEVMMFK
jgi:hypothetical protein